MDFNLLNPSFHNKTEAKPTFQLDKYNQHNPEPSDFEFSGGSPVSFTAAPPPFHNPYTQSPTNSSQTSFYDINPKISETFPLFLPNIENPNEISFQKLDSMEAMREMIFRMAMMQPVPIDPESVKLPKRKNVRISKDPQSVVARHRREKISQRIRILQRMVPGGTKLDTASMLDEAVHYLNFLKKQLEALEQGTYSNRPMGSGTFPMQIA